MSSKKITTLMLIILFCTCTVCSLDNWETRYSKFTIDDIMSIKIIKQIKKGTQEEKIIQEKKILIKLISFITNVELKSDNSNLKLDKKSWIFRIIFDGVRDQIFYFKDKAFVGKSLYKIRNSSVLGFDKLFKKIK